MTKIFLIGSLFLALIIESTLVSFPFVLVVSLFLVTVFRSNRVLIAAFICSLLLDMVRVVPVGTTPIFIFGFAFAASLYQRSLHAADVLIFAGVIFVVSIVYSRVAFYSINVVLALVLFTSILAVLSWAYSKRGILSERSLS